jgi:hypothetical protein
MYLGRTGADCHPVCCQGETPLAGHIRVEAVVRSPRQSVPVTFELTARTLMFLMSYEGTKGTFVGESLPSKRSRY